ncbi:hypothetical protein [Dyella subtropica]|uniref:hypothetical protein n=1 Tax=Dyella subtropica TaxID=2992127 RepID=UPI0022512AEC|nr:hypothetical protein [Dyella subtropica]
MSHLFRHRLCRFDIRLPRLLVAFTKQDHDGAMAHHKVNPIPAGFDDAGAAGNLPGIEPQRWKPLSSNAF